jgi:glyoxylase-like metal-dependent hydrolase (beta-lactamase superfamily II)
MTTAGWQELSPDCFIRRDACNVFVLRDGDRAVAVDYGSGAWLGSLTEIGIRHLDHVVITHGHRDQVCGLYRQPPPDACVHIPSGDASWLSAQGLELLWSSYQSAGCPPCYAPPRLPVAGAIADMAADTETIVGPARFCAVATPGHTPGALTYLVDWRGRHLAFCGDAVHAGGTLHEPYHLEWDHWTPNGCLAAWHGLERLGYCYFDWLLPAHGEPVGERPRACVSRTQRRIMSLIRAKGSVCAGERHRWADQEPMECGATRISPHLFSFGANSFLLVSQSGEGLVVDPQLADLDRLEALRRDAGVERITAATASHYHRDHSDGLNELQERYGAQTWLHPRVAEPLHDRNLYDLPWLPEESVRVDRLLPENGAFSWCEYDFISHDFPGQTRWHTALHAMVDGGRVLFSGDSYQPPSRWNGTGGFCSYNGSRFSGGFARSAQRVLEIDPELICNGHGCVYHYHRGHYRRILRWAQRAEQAIAALCPKQDWLADYDCRSLRWEPFVLPATAGSRITAELVLTNHHSDPAEISASVVAPASWEPCPPTAAAVAAGGETARLAFQIMVPAGIAPGRHIIAADVTVGRTLHAEACVALVDVS